ncbi:MAG: flagellar assembly protein FliH [Rhodoferax sp.]|nr:flagellar assembly protein FliH [Rhodoferax sp.]
MRSDSRFIPGEQIEAVAQWNFAAVDTGALQQLARANADADAAAQARDDLVRQQAFADGFAQGRAHAAIDAERHVTEFAAQHALGTAQRLAALIAQAQEQLEQSGQVIAQGVLELSCEMARQVLRHELSVNPNALQPVIREALGLLTADGKPTTVRLHPQDLEVLRDALQSEFGGMGLTVLGDPTVKPGGCLIAAAGSVVDASLETRWRRVVSNLGLQVQWDA